MPTETRLYEVCCKTTGVSRLVEAANAAQARSHVARDEYTVGIPDTMDVHRLAKQGVEIERAGEVKQEGVSDGLDARA